jgi:hypothetical protein
MAYSSALGFMTVIEASAVLGQAGRLIVVQRDKVAPANLTLHLEPSSSRKR